MTQPPPPAYGFDPFGEGDQGRWAKPGGEEAPNLPKYEIIAKLGKGGMGDVWSARYLPLNQIRAVKVLDSNLAADPSFKDRLQKEAKALARLEHPNIVRVFDASAETDPPFISMQWVDGMTLSDVLRKRTLPIPEAIRIFEQVAAALDYAHSLGFVHRDIKPSNVMITDKGDAMLIDFGVANFLGGEPIEGTTVTGTTRYLAPEIIQGRMATPAADIWAFAVLIFRVLSGHLPFDGPTTEAVFRRIVAEPPTPPPGLNPRLAKFLLGTLQKEPSLRPKTARDLVAALKLAAHWRPERGGRIALVGGGVGLVAALGVLGLALSGAFSSPAKKSEPKGQLDPPSVVQPAPGNEDPAPATNGLTASALAGVWFADFGSSWAELRMEPGDAGKLAAVLNVRDDKGIVSVRAEGELDAAGQELTIRETGVSSNPSNLPYQLSEIKARVSDDRTRISGTRRDTAVRLVRASDVTLTPLERAQDRLRMAYPNGWALYETMEGESRVASFSPIGYPAVALRVVVAPLMAGQSVFEALSAREQTLALVQAEGGVYQRMNLAEGAQIGGRAAMVWEFRHQKNGESANHGLIYAVPRGETMLTVESWMPVEEADVWGPVLERLRNRVEFLD